MTHRLSRRELLQRLGTLAGAAALGPTLTACSGAQQQDVAAVAPTLVVLMMENRSYDHLLGSRSLVERLPGDGLTAAMSNRALDGAAVGIHAADPAALCLLDDPAHGWESSRAQWNGGLNDGFVRVHAERYGAARMQTPMSFLGRAELPVTHALADVGASCDRWFASLMGPTWPNRMYLHSGQSNGRKNNDLPEGGAFTWPTIWDRLNDAGIPWGYYYSDLPFVALFPHLGVEQLHPVIWKFHDDAAAGTLPPVVFIDPAFSANDDHPPHHPMMGQMLIQSIYDALAASPQWPGCMLVVTYDEHGGFFDHVSPPTAADDRAADGFDQLGFRVPTVVAGPWVRRGHVSSVVRDHSSVLRQIAATHGLPPLGARDAAAADLSELLDLERIARDEPAPPDSLPTVFIDENELDAACRGAGKPGRRPQSELERAVELGIIPARLDLRAQVGADLRALAARLERRGRLVVRR